MEYQSLTKTMAKVPNIGIGKHKNAEFKSYGTIHTLQIYFQFKTQVEI